MKKGIVTAMKILEKVYSRSQSLKLSRRSSSKENALQAAGAASSSRLEGRPDPGAHAAPPHPREPARGPCLPRVGGNEARGRFPARELHAGTPHGRESRGSAFGPCSTPDSSAKVHAATPWAPPAPLPTCPTLAPT